jgi:hypothetical protein
LLSTTRPTPGDTDSVDELVLRPRSAVHAPIQRQGGRLRKMDNFLPDQPRSSIVFQKSLRLALAPSRERLRLSLKKSGVKDNSQRPRPEAPRSGLEGRSMRNDFAESWSVLRDAALSPRLLSTSPTLELRRLGAGRREH